MLKKAECLRIDAFRLWCWRRLLRVPWTAKRSNQSILKEINPGYSLEGLMLKLKLQYPRFFDDSMDVGNLISGSSAFSNSSFNIWKPTVHVLLKPALENFEHYFASVWDECNCVVLWTFFGIAFLRDWNENWPVLVLWPLLSFPNLLAYWVQHFHSIIFQDLK